MTQQERLTTDGLAERFGVTRRTITNWTLAGMPSLKRSGRVEFSWPACRDWREQKVREEERARAGVAGDAEQRKALADARLRIASVEAEQAELELKKQRGTLIPLWFIRAEFQRIGFALRTQLLSMPQTWAGRLGACTTTAERQLMLQDAINDLMPTLRQLTTGEKLPPVGDQAPLTS